MYVRSARNISADNLFRWSQYECDKWMYANGIRNVSLPELWGKWGREWEQRMCSSALNTFGIFDPLYQFYQNQQLRVAEWRSKMYITARIMGEHDIPTQYLEIYHRDIFQQLADTVSEYSGGDIFLLIGTCANRLAMDDFQ